MYNSSQNQIDELLCESDLIPSKKGDYNKTAKGYNFSNETILVTGAAGSIGSELSKQLICGDYKKLILVDIAESPLYSLIKDLEHKKNDRIKFILLNIANKKSVKHLFDKYKPTLVFHTAAYKHVPLMEEHPFEAIRLNVLATKLLADLSIKIGVKKFVFISTDKAVNPINIMGMTKRIAEKYLNVLNDKNRTYFVNTRFGNVFGSNGSVVPLLIKQITTGVPITITNKEISRYFICKHKACNLILKIATLNKLDSNLFTFNMGKPIKIMDLAKTLIPIFSNDKDSVQIKITGLRTGEKFDEELVSKDEVLLPTDYKDILLVKSKTSSKLKKSDFKKLASINLYTPLAEIKSILKSFMTS